MVFLMDSMVGVIDGSVGVVWFWASVGMLGTFGFLPYICTRLLDCCTPSLMLYVPLLFAHPCDICTYLSAICTPIAICTPM